MKKRIGIMGGTFDPIHIGHLILAEKAYEELDLDEVWFMPSGNPPHKQNRAGRASDKQRVEMVRRAIADNPHFRLSTEEMHPEGYTYTYETLERLHEKYPDYIYYFIIGADSLYDFDMWRRPDRICKAASLLVATRNDVPEESLKKKMRIWKRNTRANLYCSTPQISRFPPRHSATGFVRGKPYGIILWTRYVIISVTRASTGQSPDSTNRKLTAS